MSNNIFISYSHNDGYDFTRRLVFALELYMNVFWDRKLEAGDFPEYLNHEIEKCDCIVFIMTPSSIVSEWCIHEIKYAQELNKKLAPVRVFIGDSYDKNIAKTYTYADFSKDFDAGFRHLTQLIKGQSISPWEIFWQIENDDQIIDYLNQGLIPGLISKQIAEWLIAEITWTLVMNYFTDKTITVGKPRTSHGVVRMCSNLLQQFEDLNDVIGYTYISHITQLTNRNLLEINSKNDGQHKEIGELVFQLIQEVREHSLTFSQIENSALSFIQIKAFFEFDLAEKIRELIYIHASRSRYLF